MIGTAFAVLYALSQIMYTGTRFSIHHFAPAYHGNIRIRQPAGKGLAAGFVPAQQGIVDYDEIFTEIKRHHLQPVGIFMPFYEENNFPRMMEAFRAEVAYFRRCQRDAGLE